ncbi:MAG TPA: hypothetical protein VKA63_09325, partial [Candidatus Krumholzibacteria bacterium]|nr:hypothetical protein [Candidatus Krumholzibacteria bacterium]
MSANSSRSSASPRARGEASGGRRSCGTVRGEGADSNPHAFRPGLSAAQVDRELKSAVQNWRSAERCVVLWFAELHRRLLFAKLGYGSIHLYASEALGFSR